MSTKAPLLYRVLLHLLPPRFRRDFGADLEAVLVERLRDAHGVAARAWIWLVAVVDVLTSAPAEWAHALRHQRMGNAPRSNAVDNLKLDLRFALRSLGRRPGFTAIAVITLALGIGANTAIFSVLKTLLLDPLPYPDADHLVTMSPYAWTPAQIVLDVMQSGGSFEQVAAYYPQSFTVTDGEQPYQMEGARATPNFFRVLGTRMAFGRDFVAADAAKARTGAARAAVISNSAWQDRYGASRHVIGQTIEANGELYQIIGVLERGFQPFFPRSDNPALWIPFEVEPTNTDGLNEGTNYVVPVARLKSGIPLRQAQSELAVSVNRFQVENPGFRPARNLRWVTLKSELIQNVRAAIIVLQLAVIVVLLIACVNVANLLLARYNARQGEIAIRSALGASRGTLVRQLLTESVVLSSLGGLAGLLITLIGLKLMPAVTPADVPRIDDASIDTSVFFFTLAISIVTGLLFGVLPAVATTSRASNEAIKEGGRAHAQSRKQRRIGRALMTAEMALSLVLLVGAGLLARTFVSLTNQDLGFRTENVLTVSIELPEYRYESVPALTAFHSEVLERLQQLSAVESVALSKNPPISRGGSTREYLVEGRPANDGNWEEAHYDVVSPDYFRLLDLPLLRGRSFAATDRRNTLPVAIVDDALAHQAWPRQDPIGKRLRFEDDRWLTVVGVVGNTRGSGLANNPRPGFYISYQQRPETPTELASSRAHTVFLVRSPIGVEALAGSLRQAVWDVDPQQSVPEITTLNHVVSQGAAPQRFHAVLLGSFAALALVLVIAGIYGVISYTVSRQTHEFGIRMAVGATSRDVVLSVLKEALPSIMLALAFGLIGVFLATRLLEGLLFGVTPTDPLTIVVSAGVVIVVALTASFFPARKAMQVDPMTAMRSEWQPGTHSANRTTG